MATHLLNPELFKMAEDLLSQLEKRGFIAGQDPTMTGAGDPSQQGGQPPPGQAPGAPPPGAGGDPSQQGAAPPAGGAPGGGADLMGALGPMVQQAVQQAMQQNGGDGAKPVKYDMATELHKNNVLLAKLHDQLGTHIPAEELITAEEQAAQAQNNGGGPQSPASGGQQPAIQPVQPMQPAMASPQQKAGSVFLGLGHRAAALELIARQREMMASAK